MVRLRLVFILVAGLALATAPRPLAQTAPDVGTLQQAAREYVEKYGPLVSGVSLEEQLILLETTGAEKRPPQRIGSDLVLVKFDDRLIGLRDPFAVDTRPVRPHEPRIVKALSEPTQANVDLAQQYVRQNAAFLLHNVVVWYSDPVLALQYVARVHEDKLIYKIEGNKKINGVTTWGLGFKERPGATRVLSMIPGNAESWGRLWIDPATGAIHLTELWVQSQTDIVRARVEFETDKKLGWLLPRRASHNLEWREWGNNVTTNVGRAAVKLSFETNADYGKAAYTPIDLGRLLVPPAAH